jgi:hypothetical protein
LTIESSVALAGGPFRAENPGEHAAGGAGEHRRGDEQRGWPGEDGEHSAVAAAASARIMTLRVRRLVARLRRP